MSRVWFTDLRSGAGRFVRMDSARASFQRNDAPLIVRAASFAIILTLTILALLIIIPIVLFAGLFFLVAFGVMKVRRFFIGLFNALPRDDGRRNVRVRLPAESPDQ